MKTSIVTPRAALHIFLILLLVFIFVGMFIFISSVFHNDKVTQEIVDGQLQTNIHVNGIVYVYNVGDINSINDTMVCYSKRMAELKLKEIVKRNEEIEQAIKNCK